VLLMGVQLVKLSLSEIICVLKYVYSNYELASVSCDVVWLAWLVSLVLVPVV
jgi:hypothetical protein